VQLGYCDIVFFVFRHRLQIMSPKYSKFERVKNSAVKFQIAQTLKARNYESYKNGMKLSFTIA
jgi:hypothetical protein